MSERDDDDWLDALRGRVRPGISPLTSREASETRRVLKSEHEGSAELTDAAELERLLFRLRREGLLDSASTRGGRWRVPLAAAAAIVLGVAITLSMPGLWQPGDGELRGGGEVQTLEVADVDRAAAELQEALRQSGASVSVSDAGQGRREVSATVPRERIDEAARAVAGFGVRPPARDGTLRVELRARSP